MNGEICGDRNMRDRLVTWSKDSFIGYIRPMLLGTLPLTHGHQVLKASIGEQIRQLLVSPNGQFLAISTSHTVHVAILPASSAFEQNAGSPIKIKTHTLGPTTHVLSQSPVVSILWHPCGVNGTCLVTVTAEAAVRLWEFNRSNRWSFDSPSLAIDLTKLENANSQADDVTPKRMGDSRGFSADVAGMEIVSACFGGLGSPDESSWSSLTLWMATNEGDVYALCPLMPSKWQPNATQIPSLSANAMAKKASGMEDEPVTEQEKRMQTDQYAWLSEIDKQIPFLVARDDNIAINDAIYSRPKHPGPLPRLQGPFTMAAGSLVDFLDVSDICVIPPRLDAEELMLGEDDDSELGLQEETNGLSATIVCLLTTDGRVYILVDLDEIEGQWLPSKPPKNATSTPDSHELILVEALDTLEPDSSSIDEWPTFTHDPFSRYSLFTTHSQGIYFFSFLPWISRLEEELQSFSTAGTEFRLKILMESTGRLRERILNFNNHQDITPSATACVVLEDSDLGYFLLTSTDNNTHPQAVSLDIPTSALIKNSNIKSELPNEDDVSLLTQAQTVPHVPRVAYSPPPIFYTPSSSSSLLNLTTKIPPHRRRILTGEIRLSAATLDVITDAHRVVSNETYALGGAAAELFSRCERMQRELEEQVRKVRERAERVDEFVCEDEGEGGNSETTGERLAFRLGRAKQRQQTLDDRLKTLSRKIGRLGGRNLSAAERDYLKELEHLDRAVERPDDRTETDISERTMAWWPRYQEISNLKDELVERAREVSGKKGEVEKEGRGDGLGLTFEVRRRKVEEVEAMLERETDMVDAVMMRLGRLGMGV